MAGLLTLNGLILALSWSAFTKIYELVGAGDFCAFLRRHKLLSHYLAFVGYVHVAQVLAILTTAFAMLAPLLSLQLWVVKLAVALSFAATAYAIKQGVAASTVMQDLIWQRSEFEAGSVVTPTVRPVNQAN